MTDDVALPEALVDQHARLAGARAASRRLVARALSRRRLLPPLVVGSGAVLGSSAVAAWLLDQQLPVPAPAAPTVSTTARATSAGDTELSADVAALDRLAQTLAADRAAIAGLDAAGAARATSGGSGSGAAPSSVAGAGAPAPSPVGATAPLPPLPAVPALPAVKVPPPAPPPPVHTTTGATVVAP